MTDFLGGLYIATRELFKSKKTIKLIEHYEKLKNLDEQKKENNIISIKDKKKFTKKPYRKKKFFKKAK